MTKKLKIACCWECATPLRGPTLEGSNHPPKSKATKFCTDPCKATWNNRLKLRGADLVPLIFSMRYDRAASKTHGVYKEYCRLVEGWRDEDLAANGGLGRVTCEKASVVILRLMDTGRLRRGERFQDRTGRRAA